MRDPHPKHGKQHRKGVVPVDLLALLIRPTVVADGNLVKPFTAKARLCQDLGMLLPAHRVKALGRHQIVLEHQVAGINVRPGRVVEYVKTSGDYSISDLVPEARTTCPSGCEETRAHHYLSAKTEYWDNKLGVFGGVVVDISSIPNPRLIFKVPRRVNVIIDTEITNRSRRRKGLEGWGSIFCFFSSPPSNNRTRKLTWRFKRAIWKNTNKA